MYSTQSDQQTASTAATGKSSRDRRCFVTYARKPIDELVRFVVAPDKSVVPDLAERLPGRGLWLSASRETVNTACAKHLFAKAAGGPVAVREHLADEIEEQLDSTTVLYPFKLIFPQNKVRTYYLRNKADKDNWVNAIK